MALWGYVPANCGAADWRDIVYIACGSRYKITVKKSNFTLLGLSPDGSVEARTPETDYNREVGSWRNIVEFEDDAHF